MLSKVIIEAALLTDDEKVTACTLAKAAGADYVKTSTGFGPGGATAADVALMRRVVGAEMGVKAAGGVRDLESVNAMIAAGATRVGASAGVKIVQQARDAVAAVKRSSAGKAARYWNRRNNSRYCSHVVFAIGSMPQPVLNHLRHRQQRRRATRAPSRRRRDGRAVTRPRRSPVHAKNDAMNTATSANPSVKPRWPKLPPNCQSNQLAIRKRVDRQHDAPRPRRSADAQPRATIQPATASSSTGRPEEDVPSAR